ncbi:MAG: hemolysin family protein [Clostridiales bacterium]|jgi:CBS domain containing-hemolysin-like protein|nr:hemolysin family protein [Clostridiales bacterium]
MDNYVALIIVLIVLLVLAAFFSAWESACLHVSKTRLKSAGEKAAKAIEILEERDSFAYVVMTGETLCVVAASVTTLILFRPVMGQKYASITAIAAAAATLLVFCVVLPKTLVKKRPEGFIIAFLPVFRLFHGFFAPISALVSFWERLLIKLFKVTDQTSITEEELLSFVGEARQEGGINEQEEEMIRSVIEFDDLEAADICTPRVDVRAVSKDSSTEDITAIFRETGYSRLPIYEESIDNIIGLALNIDFFYMVETLGQPLESIIRPVIFVTKSVKISKLLVELQQNKTHLAVVVDEFGGTVGIVTIEDIVEELVGEIWDEHDEVVQEIEQLDENCWRFKGDADIDDMFEIFGLKDEQAESVTVGGWIVEELGRVPVTGEQFDYKNLRVTVTEVLKHRVFSATIEMAE